jgi:hypothetical protein
LIPSVCASAAHPNMRAFTPPLTISTQYYRRCVNFWYASLPSSRRWERISLKMNDITPRDIQAFFAWSDCLDHDVLRPLTHIKANWEIMWDHDKKCYNPEYDSFAEELNILINDISITTPSSRYHDNEDILANYVKQKLKWPIFKKNGRWAGADYPSILEQGGFYDIEHGELLTAATGRIYIAIRKGQIHYDKMESGHRKMLSAVLAIVLYHR